MTNRDEELKSAARAENNANRKDNANGSQFDARNTFVSSAGGGHADRKPLAKLCATPIFVPRRLRMSSPSPVSRTFDYTMPINDIRCAALAFDCSCRVVVWNRCSADANSNGRGSFKHTFQPSTALAAIVTLKSVILLDSFPALGDLSAVGRASPAYPARYIGPNITQLPGRPHPHHIVDSLKQASWRRLTGRARPCRLRRRPPPRTSLRCGCATPHHTHPGQELGQLRKENFNLKLRMYYMENDIMGRLGLASADIVKLVRCGDERWVFDTGAEH